MLDGSRKLAPIFGPRNRRIHDRRTIRMRKVDKRARRNSAKQARAIVAGKRIPSHMRRFDALRKSLAIPRKQSKTRNCGGFVTGADHHLHSHAEPKTRTPASSL